MYSQSKVPGFCFQDNALLDRKLAVKNIFGFLVEQLSVPITEHVFCSFFSKDKQLRLHLNALQ